jgi:tRNA threonylcarbamoyl adenosine modification protein YjeE
MNSIKTKPLTCNQADALSGIVANHIQPGDVVALSGDLGAGKTTFVSLFTNHMKPEPEVAVTSPTYVIHHIYPARMNIHHIDLYRLESGSVIDSLGFEEFLGQDGVALIEWFERAPKLWTGPTLSIRIEIVDMEHRTYEFSTIGKDQPHWLAMRNEIKKNF